MKPILMIGLLVLAGCSSGSAATSTPQAPTFDVAAVKASFTEECQSPIIVDDLFCQQVEIGGMTSDGDILRVPTGLNAAATRRADAICAQVAQAHFDGNGKDLGYGYIGILDKDGGNAAACSVN